MEMFTRTLTILRDYFSHKVNEPQSQRQLVLITVCIALLLDNMLYMVIVPIIPDYLKENHALSHKERFWRNATKTTYVTLKNHTNITVTSSQGKFEFKWLVSDSSDVQIGVLFASKAIIQLFCNPFSGTIIDRVGYDKPMMLGLTIIFFSTLLFAIGNQYSVMFGARALQGVGSAFADTSGLAMIADRYTEEATRSKALGIALAFISFGSLVAPPFGGILYQLAGKELPFVFLALIALFDGFLLMAVMKPVRLERREKKAEGVLLRGTPIHRLLIDPYIAICAGALAMSNVSLAFLEPTIANWMEDTMKATNWQMGLVWLPAFFPHVLGVYTTVKLAAAHPQKQWLMAAIGLGIEGTACLFIPMCTNFVALMIPICIICYGIALVDTALLPTMGYLVDTRHVSVYGSVYAIADISYSLAYAIGPIVAGGLVNTIKFTGLNIFIFLTNILFCPVIYFLKNIYKYQEFEPDTDDADAQAYAAEKAGLTDQQPRSYMIKGSGPDNKGSLDANGDYPPTYRDDVIGRPQPAANWMRDKNPVVDDSYGY